MSFTTKISIVISPSVGTTQNKTTSPVLYAYDAYALKYACAAISYHMFLRYRMIMHTNLPLDRNANLLSHQL